MQNAWTDKDWTSSASAHHAALKTDAWWTVADAACATADAGSRRAATSAPLAGAAPIVTATTDHAALAASASTPAKPTPAAPSPRVRPQDTAHTARALLDILGIPEYTATHTVQTSPYQTCR